MLIRKQLSSDDMLRHVTRNKHDGIVGARIRGAKESRMPIILFLDSHAECAAGWLEPLVARIHEDKTRVVVRRLCPPPLYPLFRRLSHIFCFMR